MNPTAYPLCWPENQPRSRTRTDWPGTTPTPAQAVAEVEAEVRRMPNATLVAISTNIPLGPKGGLRADLMYKASDQGAAVWFTRKGKLLCIACDRFRTVAANLRAIAKIIEGRRREERYGTDAMVEASWQAFDAQALPAPKAPVSSPRHWSEVLKIAPDAPLAVAEAAYKGLARINHPDVGGDAAVMAELNAAMEAARRER